MELAGHGVIGKRQMAKYLENYFIEQRFPVPGEYTQDLEEYFSEIIDKEKLDCTSRLKAAYELGTLNGFKSGHRYSLALQMSMAGTVALKRYAKLAARFR